MPDHPTTSQRVDSTRVFVSWSGDRSKVLAEALKDWLPLVLHYVEPWMSEASIDAGQRWSVAIAKELEVSNFGIICITRENVNAPWVLFEAGALAKSMEDSRVIPLVLDMDFKDISGPLAQFQMKKAERDGVLEVVQSINQASGLAVREGRASDLFDALWPKLEEQIATIPKPASGAKTSRPTSEVMEELVAGVRSLEIRVRDMLDSPRPSRHRRMKRLHPFMLRELGHVLGENSSGATSLLVMASFFREDMPWLYELAMEAHRAMRAGHSEAVAEALHRFRHAADFFLRGPLPSEEFGIDRRELHDLLRELEYIIENVQDQKVRSEADAESAAKPKKQIPPKRRRPTPGKATE